MQKVRVLVANRPRLMRELVLATIADQPDIEIMGEVGDDSEIIQIVTESKPDFVVVALDKTGQRPLVCDELLQKYPHMKVLALAPERNSMLFFWSVVEIHSASIENSQAGILNILRGKGSLVA
jgi:DNA-binding NarL/FixJ family response regulator